MLILAFVDGSLYSKSVVDHAAWVAGRTGASVKVLHVLGRRETSSIPINISGSIGADARDTLLAELASLDEQKARLAQKRGRVILDSARTRLAEVGVTEVGVNLRQGDLVEALQDQEGDVDLIVVGKRGEAADFARGHLGSNLERVVRGARKPVLIASRAFRPITRVLVAFDGGRSAAKALEFLAAGRLGPDLRYTLLTVADLSSEAMARLEAAAAGLRASGVTVETAVEPGQAEEVISRRVTHADIDLLVMGAYGHSRVHSLIIGSTTSELIRTCRVPVLVFR